MNDSILPRKRLHETVPLDVLWQADRWIVDCLSKKHTASEVSSDPAPPHFRNIVDVLMHLAIWDISADPE